MKSHRKRKSSRGRRPASPGVVLATLAVLFPADALAYLDPGTGSFLFQGMIAVVVGVGVAVKMFWRRIRAFLSGKPLPGDHEHDE